MNEERYLDEKIIEMINLVEKPEDAPILINAQKEIPPEERTIYSGIKVNGQWVEFEERSFVNDRVTIMIPKSFHEMDAESAKLKYPMERRPPVILTDHTSSINILFNIIDISTNNESIASIRDGLFYMMNRMNPGIKLQSMGEERIDNRIIAYVEFTNPALDGKIYNLMFYLDLDGKPLMGSFNCLTKSMKYWKKAAFEIMQSIKIISN